MLRASYFLVATDFENLFFSLPLLIYCNSVSCYCELHKVDKWHLFWQNAFFFFYLHLQRLLFFVHRPVGMPKMEKVYLHNPSSEQISLISISATTAHFHASFFQNRVSTSHFKTTLRRSHEWLLILPRFMRHFQTSETLFKKNNMSFSHLSGDVCFLDLL